MFRRKTIRPHIINKIKIPVRWTLFPEMELISGILWR